MLQKNRGLKIKNAFSFCKQYKKTCNIVTNLIINKLRCNKIHLLQEKNG